MSLDHKPLDELRPLFRGFVARAERAVLNLDNPETAALAREAGAAPSPTACDDPPGRPPGRGAALPAPDGVGFDVALKAGPGRPAQSAAPCRARRAGPPQRVQRAGGAGAAHWPAGCRSRKPRRRSAAFRRHPAAARRVGTAGGVTVIDDFAHNPDKIAATLQTLHGFPGRLLVMFQPHGYGPLRLMGDDLAAGFAADLAEGDVLLMPEPVYFGGTVDRSVGSRAVAGRIAAAGRQAEALPDRAACGERLLALVRPGDRIVVMGARDDTLSVFARGLLERLGRNAAAVPTAEPGLAE